MTYVIAPYPYRMARRWARLAEMEQPESYRYTLSVNVREQEDAYVVNALVPGLKAEDLHIQVVDDVVTIEGEFKNDDAAYLLHELPHGAFRRTLRLPAPLDASQAEASIQDGVLTLVLPKAESARPKSIKITAK
jgi:HSP20 family protein